MIRLKAWQWALAGGVGLLVAAKAFAGGATPMADSAQFSPTVAKRRKNAQTIERVLRSNGYDYRTVGAAIANAIGESGLNPDAVGDSGHSVGVFQLHDQGGGHGMTHAQRSDVATATQALIDRELRSGSKHGRNWREVADNPASSLGDLTEAWCRFVERPKNQDADSASRRAIAAKLWPELA